MLNNTLYNLDITYHNSKYSCIKDFYFIHVVFCYIVFLTGIACFITRLHSRLTIAHQYLGKFYILSMLYATASSLLIHNSGLPEAVLISFIYVICGLTLAWILILIHKVQFTKKLNSLTKKNDPNPINTIDKSKNCCKRTFSLKSFHGVLMFLSWFNIAGRIFASDQSGDFTCYTYPVYKPIASNTHLPSNITNTLIPLPAFDKRYSRLPWANQELLWSMITLFGPILFGFIVSSIWSCIYTSRYRLKFFK